MDFLKRKWWAIFLALLRFVVTWKALAFRQRFP